LQAAHREEHSAGCGELTRARRETARDRDQCWVQWLKALPEYYSIASNKLSYSKFDKMWDKEIHTLGRSYMRKE
jgi:hypothetical protein